MFWWDIATSSVFILNEHLMRGRELKKCASMACFLSQGQYQDHTQGSLGNCFILEQDPNLAPSHSASDPEWGLEW